MSKAKVWVEKTVIPTYGIGGSPRTNPQESTPREPMRACARRFLI